ncbi:MAG: DUF4112 domain-containing protein [Bryobacterales bacterium]|nr:DUF4112 domain-containing protein [Bryobacterales bacterium]
MPTRIEPRSERIHQPEVISPGRSSARIPDNILDLERLMDRWIQVGPFSFGLDGILGLVPGLGDLASGLISAYIIAHAARNGVPQAALARMMTNVAIDSILGMVPFIGDLFDFLFKANTKNLAIYREALAGNRSPAKDWGFVAVVLTGVLLLLAIPVSLGIYLLLQLLRTAGS